MRTLPRVTNSMLAANHLLRPRKLATKMCTDPRARKHVATDVSLYVHQYIYICIHTYIHTYILQLKDLSRQGREALYIVTNFSLIPRVLGCRDSLVVPCSWKEFSYICNICIYVQFAFPKALMQSSTPARRWPCQNLQTARRMAPFARSGRVTRLAQSHKGPMQQI